MPHPRFYGTFPRIIGHYAYDEHVLPLETAIHKMTGATARALKLRDRGLLREGWRADLTIFGAADFRDRATYAAPQEYPSGPRTTVIVNGTIVVDNASHAGALPGTVLRRAADGYGRMTDGARADCGSDKMPGSIAYQSGDNLFESASQIRFSAAAEATFAR